MGKQDKMITVSKKRDLQPKMISSEFLLTLCGVPERFEMGGKHI